MPAVVAAHHFLERSNFRGPAQMLEQTRPRGLVNRRNPFINLDKPASPATGIPIQQRQCPASSGRQKFNSAKFKLAQG